MSDNKDTRDNLTEDYTDEYSRKIKEIEEQIEKEAAAEQNPSAQQPAGEETGKASGTEGSGESQDILDDIEFISQESVRDRSKMAKGHVIEDDMVSEKKTKRRGVDVEEAKKEKSRKVVRKFLPLIIFLIIVAVAAACFLFYYLKDLREKKTEENREQPVSSQEYEKDGYEKINALVSNYYACYAQGDTEKILQYAYPMSDSEKSYIQMYSEFVEEYQNLVCYTKTGADDKSYIVSAAFDVKYRDAETAAPGMDFFYVRENEDGSVYIDNVYSAYNQLYQEFTLDQDILKLITDYEAADDVIALQAGVQTKYEQVLSQDESLSNLVSGALDGAVSAWKSEHEAEIAQKAQEAAAAAGGEDQQTAETGQPAEGTEQPAQEETPAAENTGETEQKAWVYATESVNIRSSADENSEILASVIKGSEVRQLAVTSNGWSKIKTGEIVGYIKSEYLTDQKPASSSSGTALTEGKQIRLSASVNVRKSMSESSERVGLAYEGETVTVIQSYSEGWTKVEWNGKTGYIKTDILAGM